MIVLPMGNLYMLTASSAITSSEGGVVIGPDASVTLTAGEDAVLNFEFSCQ